MLLYLVRHGQSVWNAEKRHQGWQDVPLSEEGKIQAERIGARLKNQKFDFYFTSPIHRCAETAGIIVQAQGLNPDETLVVDEELREARISARLEGVANKDLFKTWTEEQKRSFQEDYNFKWDDGESVREVIERTLSFFNRITALGEVIPEPNPDDEQFEDQIKKIPPKTALIVAHNIQIQIMVLHALDALDTVARKQNNIDRLNIGNCSLTLIQTLSLKNSPLMRVLTVNETCHLAGNKKD